MNAQPSWYIYILQCSDLTLYTGISNDLPRRLDEHNLGPRGSRYTRARRPVVLVYLEAADNRAAASRREYDLKQLTRAAKIDLIGRSRRHAKTLLKTLGKSAPRLENVRQ